MRKKVLSLLLALALSFGLAIPAMAATVPTATPEVGTSLAHVSVSLDEEDAAGYVLFVDYVFAIDRQGVLWQYKSGSHRTDSPITGGFQKKQITDNVIQIGEQDEGIGILKSDGTLLYLHLNGEEQLYEIASGVARLEENRYLTRQGELWRYNWDFGGAIVLTPEGAKREREPGVKTTLVASNVISFSSSDDFYVTADNVLHYTYYDRSNSNSRKQDKVLGQIQSVCIGMAGAAQNWGIPTVYYAIDINGNLYARGINTSGFVGNGGVYDDMYAEFWGNIKTDVWLAPSLDVYEMDYIMGNIERVWVSDAAYALDKNGDFWIWGDFNQSAKVMAYSTPRVQYDMLIQSGGKSYCADVSNLPEGKAYASPRKMHAGEAVSMLRNYRQGADGTIYVALGEDEKEYALPHTGGVLGGDLNFSIGNISNGFADVPANAYYSDAVAWAVEKNITSGTSATTFSPDQTCTRAQIITFLWRAAASPEPKNASPFSDVKANTYYAKAAIWAAENGMASGTTFSPDAPCTREMAVEFMWKHAGSPGAAKASFTDVSSDAVNWAVEKGVTSGTSTTTFSPNQACTRGQIVTFLYRAFAE